MNLKIARSSTAYINSTSGTMIYARIDLNIDRYKTSLTQGDSKTSIVVLWR